MKLEMIEGIVMDWMQLLKEDDRESDRKYTLEDYDLAESHGVSLNFVEETEEMFKGAMQRAGEEKMTVARAKKLRALYENWDNLDDEQIKSIVGVLQLGWPWPNNIYLPFKQPFKSVNDAEDERLERDKRRNQRITATIHEMERSDHLPEDDKRRIIEALTRRLR